MLGCTFPKYEYNPRKEQLIPSYLPQLMTYGMALSVSVYLTSQGRGVSQSLLPEITQIGCWGRNDSRAFQILFLRGLLFP
jgi:hypothetical protein